jgi:hypothetical protein
MGQIADLGHSERSASLGSKRNRIFAMHAFEPPLGSQLIWRNTAKLKALSMRILRNVAE